MQLSIRYYTRGSLSYRPIRGLIGLAITDWPWSNDGGGNHGSLSPLGLMQDDLRP